MRETTTLLAAIACPRHLFLQLARSDVLRYGCGAAVSEVTDRAEDETPSRGAAGAYLRELLGRRAYRRIWERHLGRPGGSTVNQAA